MIACTEGTRSATPLNFCSQKNSTVWLSVAPLTFVQQCEMYLLLRNLKLKKEYFFPCHSTQARDDDDDAEAEMSRVLGNP